MNLGQIFRETVKKLENAGIPSPKLDAEVLICHVLEIESYKIVTEPDTEIAAGEIESINEVVSRRLNFEPVAYITGHREFYSLDFTVNRNVLIPRPETELLVDMGIYWGGYNESLLDLCTGSGAVAISIKKNRKDLQVSASDISHGALEVAMENASDILGESMIGFHHGSLFDPFEGMKFNVIVSNPPYIDPNESGNLQRDLGFEPEEALYCEDRGRSVIKDIISQSPDYLLDGGTLILEIGHDQKDYVVEQGELNGFEVSVLNDYAGLPRIATFKQRQ